MNEAQASPNDKPTNELLDPVEIRVLGVLAEKEASTPDVYPLSLNALTNGCNQLTSREPVMSLSEDEVRQALQRLVQKKLVSEVSQSGARVSKYEHRMRIRWMLEQDKLSLLAILMLRGPQTAGEIRNRAGRLHEFASVAEAEAGLQFLMDKYPPLVARLPRTPGTKELRYAHMLASELPAEEMPAAVYREDRAGAGSAALEQEVAELRARIDELTAQFETFKRQFE